MSTDPTRATYVGHLQQVYGLGVKDSDNTIASYDHYFKVMKPGLSVGALVGSILARKPVARVLDIGCGDAGMLKELLRKHPGKIDAHGFDLVAPKVGKQGLQFHEGDALELPFPSDCDLIVSFRAMHEVGALDRLVPKVARALAVGGHAFLSVRISELSLEPGCSHPGLERHRPASFAWELRQAMEGRPSPPGVEFQGSIMQHDLDWLRGAAAKGIIDGTSIACAEVMGQIPGKRDTTFVRGVNVFLERV